MTRQHRFGQKQRWLMCLWLAVLPEATADHCYQSLPTWHACSCRSSNTTHRQRPSDSSQHLLSSRHPLVQRDAILLCRGTPSSCAEGRECAQCTNISICYLSVLLQTVLCGDSAGCSTPKSNPDMCGNAAAQHAVQAKKRQVLLYKHSAAPYSSSSVAATAAAAAVHASAQHAAAAAAVAVT